MTEQTFLQVDREDSEATYEVVGLAPALGEDGIDQEDGTVDDGQGGLREVLVAVVTATRVLVSEMFII